MNQFQFNLTVDKPAKKVTITTEFPAALSLVWDAFTTKELLDRWVAPKPYMSKTKYIDFKGGGRRAYAMVSPEGMERWSVQDYISVTPKSHFKMYNAFADENENRELPGSEWDFDFNEVDGITTVRIEITNESSERMEKILEMGFAEGYKMTIENLAQLLAELSKKPESGNADHDLAI